MDYSKYTKQQLLEICATLGITKCVSKTKPKLIELIQQASTQCNTNIIPNIPKNTTNVEATSTKNEKPGVMLKPLVKWSGGKSDEIKLFEKYIPKCFQMYIEPFVGGGSVYFHIMSNPNYCVTNKHNNVNVAVINDVHPELIALYRSIGKGEGREIYNFMENTPNDETTYYHVRDHMEIQTPLDNAKRFYYQRKTCFRGMLRYNKNGKFNIPFGKYKTINYNELLNPKYEEVLSKTEILNTGFETIFEKYNDETNFMFLDPPYDSEFTDYGYCQFGKEEHKKLAECFKTTKIKCLMVIGKTDFIVDLYRDYIVGEYDKKYRFKLYDKRVGDEINTVHLVIANYNTSELY